MLPAQTQTKTLRATRHRPGPGALRAGRRGFTLLEWLVSMAIIALLFSLSVFVFRRAAAHSVMAQARNAVSTYAQVARSYAVANHIETMMVINPVNGRFEVWYLNPPPEGGPWDPASSGLYTDGYAFAPILDPAARLPMSPNGEPAAAAHPIDYDARRAGAGSNQEKMDSLNWTAFCFDENGQLVIRSRRIATRLFHRWDGTIAAVANRLEKDGTPNMALLSNSPYVMVDAGDSLITSTRGLVLSERPRMKGVLGANSDANRLVDLWLMRTRNGERYADAADTFVLNRFSGQELVGETP
jgi:prepilin-type N-terminal cleavage/methylation domain-containing protein